MLDGPMWVRSNGRDALIPLLIGATAGVASGLFGIGGGLIIVPALVLIENNTQHKAHATSLAAVTIIAAAAAIPYLVSGNVYLLLSASMAASAVLTARLGAWLMHRLSEAQLKLLFGLLMLLVAVRMFIGIEPRPSLELQSGVAVILLGLAIGVVAGLSSSLLGIGGGLIMVPAMVLTLGISQHLAVGTSLLAIVPTALSGTLANRRSEDLDLKVAVAVAAGGTVAGTLSSTLALRLSGLLLQRGLAILLVLAMTRIIAPAIRNRLTRSMGRRSPSRTPEE